ncbi:MAG: hypothetical protein QG648_395 [Patescibacteria group bacterium]|nr:hypothetical protein [Patescibacteria group bacterium]
MTEKELLEQLNQLKEVKPNQAWGSWLLSHILSQKSTVLTPQPQVKWAGFSFLKHYQKVLIPAFCVFLFVSSLALAQNSLPGNPFYSLKTLTQNVRLALAPQSEKPVVRLEIAQARLEDLKKTKDQEEKVASLTQTIKKDLNTIPQELKNIPQKQVALKTSQRVQEKTQNLTKLVEETNLKPAQKEELTNTVAETQNQVLALISETTEELNQCPNYLQNKLNDLQNYFVNQAQELTQWSAEDLTKVKMSLSEATNLVKAGNCLEAIEKIESINQLLQIHSLDTSSPQLEVQGVQVETSTSSTGE